MAGEQEVARAQRVQVVHHVAQPAQRESDAGAARLPERQREAVEERPERPVGWAVPEGLQPLAVPGLQVPMQRDHPVGEPSDVAGEGLPLYGGRPTETSSSAPTPPGAKSTRVVAPTSKENP